MDGGQEHELTCAVNRARYLMSILDREHTMDQLYKALHGVRFELDTMATRLPPPPPLASHAGRPVTPHQLPLL